MNIEIRLYETVDFFRHRAALLPFTLLHVSPAVRMLSVPSLREKGKKWRLETEGRRVEGRRMDWKEGGGWEGGREGRDGGMEIITATAV